MNKREAQVIAEFVQTYCATVNNLTGMSAESVIERFVQTAEGMRGSGICICPNNPASFVRMWGNTPEKLSGIRGCMILDHRCSEHGEKAQPALWGRHKEKQLNVSWKEWSSLGVVYPVQS